MAKILVNFIYNKAKDEYKVLEPDCVYAEQKVAVLETEDDIKTPLVVPINNVLTVVDRERYEAIHKKFHLIADEKGNVSEHPNGAEVWLPKDTDIKKLKVIKGQLVKVEEPKEEEKPKKTTKKEEQSMPTNAKYKVYDSAQQAWVEYHFTTNAGQITTTTTANGVSGRKFVTDYITINSNSAGTTGARVVTGSDNNANIEIDGAHITGQASAVSGSSLQYVSASDTIAVALGKLDKAAKDAYDRSPDVSGLVPYNNATQDVSLGSHSLTTTAGVYVGSGGVYTTKYDYDGIDVLAYGDSTGKLLFPTMDGNETIAVVSQLASYVPTSRTVNGQALTGNVSVTPSNIYVDGNGTTLATYLSGLSNSVSGMTTSYAISDGAITGYLNDRFASTSSELSIIATSANDKIKDLNNNDIYLSTLKVGDSIFISQSNVPDRWLASKVHDSGSGSTTYTFYKLETYDMTWGAITGKPTTIAGYGITDASINTTTKAITLGSNSVSPVTQVYVGSTSYSPSNGVVSLPAYPDVSGFVPYANAADNVNLGQYSLIAKDVGVYYDNLHAILTTTGIEMGYQSNNGVLAFPLIGNGVTKTIATTDQVPIVTVNQNQPSSAKAGDIWIQTA